MNSTKLLEEVESAQLGLGIVRSLTGLDADEAQNALVKEYQDGNMQLWKSRLARLGYDGGPESSDIPESEKSGDMGHTVSIGNENHYHYSNQAPSDASPPAAAPASAPEPLDYDKLAAAVAGRMPAAPVPQVVDTATLAKQVASQVPPVVAQPMSNWAKAGIAAAALGGAVAAGAALMPDGRSPSTDTDTSVRISIPAEDRTQ